MTPRRELGSEFHWMGFPSGPFIPWPGHAIWYALGRHAVAALAAKLGDRVRPRLWIPDFFCHDLVRAWGTFAEMVCYRDDPRRPEPDWDSLRPEPTDLVLAVNFFGARDGDAWSEWRRRHPCLLVEDHTHDPASPWARTSSADYAFGSLRKTLPLPDGALLWSPIGRSLPAPPGDTTNSGAELKLEAMLLKSTYLTDQTQTCAELEALKTRFRRLQLEGETHLQSGPIASASAVSRAWLAAGFPAEARRIRRDNVAFLSGALGGLARAQPLNHSWPADAAPLGFVLVFATADERDRTRERLRAADMYCPVHWPAPACADESVRELSARLLTIPIDQRYGHGDMKRIVTVLTASTRRSAPRPGARV